MSEVVAEVLNASVVGVREGGEKTAQETASQLGITVVSKACLIQMDYFGV